MITKLDKARQTLIKIMSSNYVFILILLLAALQGLWYALTFKASMYDELHHFDFTRFYTHQFSPFISNQDPKWDFLGELTRNGNYLFYYIMSWPLRFAKLLTDSSATQLIFLRVICISFFVTALFYFSKAFTLAGVKKYMTNVALLFFVLTPGVAILPGVFNYDNIVIFLTALLLYLCVKILKSQDINFYKVTSLLLIGLLGSLVKMTFLVIYSPVIIYLAIHLWKKHGNQLINKIIESFKSSNKWLRILLLALLFMSSVLFVERTVTNIIVYQKISAPCTEILSKERCLKNPLAERAIVNKQKVKEKGDTYKPIIIQEYFLKLWAPHMIKHQASPTKALPVMKNMYYTFALIGVALILVYIRTIIKKPQYLLMSLPVAVYPLAVLYTNYSSYVALGIPVAMNGRYLFPIMPIVILFFIMSSRKVFEGHKNIGMLILLLLIFLMTQGGGITTYILDNFEPVYWENEAVNGVEDTMEHWLNPLVKGR